jgi:hypothetical protein
MNDTHPTRLLITIPLVLSCLIVNDLPAESESHYDFCLTVRRAQTFSQVCFDALT